MKTDGGLCNLLNAAEPKVSKFVMTVLPVIRRCRTEINTGVLPSYSFLFFTNNFNTQDHKHKHKPKTTPQTSKKLVRRLNLIFK